MSKITSKLQVTVPKVLADRYHLRPGDKIDWQDGGDTIRVIPHGVRPSCLPPDVRLRLFDEATRRQRRRQARKRSVKRVGGA